MESYVGKLCLSRQSQGIYGQSFRANASPITGWDQSKRTSVIREKFHEMTYSGLALSKLLLGLSEMPQALLVLTADSFEGCLEQRNYPAARHSKALTHNLIVSNVKK